jgi:hypothetical protein
MEQENRVKAEIGIGHPLRMLQIFNPSSFRKIGIFILAEPQPLADNPFNVTAVFQRLGILAPSPDETEFDKKHA